MRLSPRISVCATLVLLAASAAQGQIPLDRQVGEIFAAVGNGQYQVWHFTASGTLVETITQDPNGTNISGATAGCAFDPTYHPFTTNLINSDVFRHAIDDPQTVIKTIPTGAQPTSVAFDALGDSYVGISGGNGLIQEYSPSGSMLGTLPVNTKSLKAGSPWIDLSVDGKTIYFTNANNSIQQFAVSSSKVSSFANISG